MIRTVYCSKVIFMPSTMPIVFLVNRPLSFPIGIQIIDRIISAEGVRWDAIVFVSERVECEPAGWGVQHRGHRCSAGIVCCRNKPSSREGHSFQACRTATCAGVCQRAQVRQSASVASQRADPRAVCKVRIINTNWAAGDDFWDEILSLFTLNCYLQFDPEFHRLHQ